MLEPFPGYVWVESSPMPCDTLWFPREPLFPYACAASGTGGFSGDTEMIAITLLTLMLTALLIFLLSRVRRKRGGGSR